MSILDTALTERKFYLHIKNMAPSELGALADLTLELEIGGQIVIGRYTPDKTLSIATGLQPEGIVNPPLPPHRKPGVKKIGLDFNSVSRNHGTFSREGHEVYYRDHSRYGTAYRDHKFEGYGKAIITLSDEMIKIMTGDVLYFGKHTEDIPYKYSITLLEETVPSPDVPK